MLALKETTETYTFWSAKFAVTQDVEELKDCRVYTPEPADPDGARYATRSLPAHSDYVFERIGLTCFATRKEALYDAMGQVKRRLSRANFEDAEKLNLRLRYLEDEYDPAAAAARKKKEKLAKQGKEKATRTIKDAASAARKSSVPTDLENA